MAKETVIVRVLVELEMEEGSEEELGLQTGDDCNIQLPDYLI